MIFQASDYKGKQFLDLLDGDNNIIKPSYTKDRAWLKYFGHSNSLCTRALRAITNYALIGEYRCFSLGKNLSIHVEFILLS